MFKINWKLLARLVGITILTMGMNVHQTRPAIAINDAIIAVVNDEVITLRDLQEYIRSAYIGMVAQGLSQEKIKQVMLDLEINGINNLIEDKLMLSKANQLKMEIRDKAVEQEIENVKKKYKSEDEFMKALIQHGGTMTDLRNKIIEQLKIKYVIDNQVRSKIYIGPQEVTEYYNQHQDEFKTGEQMVLDSIFIPFASTRDEAMQKAKEAHRLLKEEKDFATVAKEYTKTPSIGKVTRGQFVKEIDTQLFNLNQGDISELIEVTNGVYIFKVTEKTPATIATLREVKDYITNILFNRKFQVRIKEWIDKLKEDAYIEFKK